MLHGKNVLRYTSEEFFPGHVKFLNANYRNSNGSNKTYPVRELRCNVSACRVFKKQLLLSAQQPEKHCKRRKEYADINCACRKFAGDPVLVMDVDIVVQIHNIRCEFKCVGYTFIAVENAYMARIGLVKNTKIVILNGAVLLERNNFLSGFAERILQGA